MQHIRVSHSVSLPHYAYAFLWILVNTHFYRVMPLKCIVLIEELTQGLRSSLLPCVPSFHLQTMQEVSRIL